MIIALDLQTEIHDLLRNEVIDHDTQCIEVTYAPFTITIGKGRLGVAYDWSAKHESFGVLRANIPAESVADAKHQAAEWVAAWIANDANC